MSDEAAATITAAAVFRLRDMRLDPSRRRTSLDHARLAPLAMLALRTL
jgi:hypothetical protein